MNVIFIYLKGYSQTGGIEAFNKKFIRALDEIEVKNLNIHVLSLYDLDTDFNKAYSKINFEGFNGRSISMLKSLIKLVDSETTVFYGHINIAPFAILLYLLGLNRKAYFIIHGIEVWRRLSIMKIFFLKKFKYLSVSSYTKKIFSLKNNVDLNKISIFPNCIDITTSRNLNPYDETEFNLLTVSRLDPRENYKGIDTLIGTIPFLKNKIPNLKLTIIGKGDDQKRLINIAENLDVKKYVDFKGFVETIEGYYEHCDLFSLPSNGEGFGIVYLEAMKYGKLVIAADARGATDVIQNNLTGKLCPYGNINCISEAILEAYDFPEKHKKIGVSGKDYLVDNFTFEKFKERLELIISKKNIDFND